MRSPSPRVTYSYSDPAVRTSLASLDTIQPIAKTPIPAISTDSGDAMPPPLPVTLATPTTSGITKAEVNTGPMNPTDCAITSGNDNTLAPRRPLSGWGFSMTSTISFLSSLRGRAGDLCSRLREDSRRHYDEIWLCPRHLGLAPVPGRDLTFSHMAEPGKPVSVHGEGFLSRSLSAGPDVLSVNPEAS